MGVTETRAQNPDLPLSSGVILECFLTSLSLSLHIRKMGFVCQFTEHVERANMSATAGCGGTVLMGQRPQSGAHSLRVEGEQLRASWAQCLVAPLRPSATPSPAVTSHQAQRRSSASLADPVPRQMPESQAVTVLGRPWARLLGALQRSDGGQ